MDNFTRDKSRQARTGVAEAVFCLGKHSKDLQAIIEFNISNESSVLLTRLEQEQWLALPLELCEKLDYDSHSKTAIFNCKTTSTLQQGICIVTAGTSDLSVGLEAQRTLVFNGFDAPLYPDLGVAGLWRLMEKIDELRQYKMIIAIAGMEGALFSVLAGLVAAPIIAVPTSIGYGVASGGRSALDSALSSCAPGLLTVNIDNGFGAAAAAIKTMRQFS